MKQANNKLKPLKVNNNLQKINLTIFVRVEKC
jgi:hypothetical protein